MLFRLSRKKLVLLKRMEPRLRRKSTLNGQPRNKRCRNRKRVEKNTKLQALRTISNCKPAPPCSTWAKSRVSIAAKPARALTSKADLCKSFWSRPSPRRIETKSTGSSPTKTSSSLRKLCLNWQSKSIFKSFSSRSCRSISSRIQPRWWVSPSGWKCSCLSIGKLL